MVTQAEVLAKLEEIQVSYCDNEDAETALGIEFHRKLSDGLYTLIEDLHWLAITGG